MPRQAAISVENSFKGGLVTEASGLNFPENACTETENCVFSFDGSVQRRLGYDFEPGFTEKNINRADNVVCSYLWKNVTGDGGLTLLVVQVGISLYFYRTDLPTLSDGALDTTLSLNSFRAAGSPSVATRECQFADGNGRLFVTHPYCDPVMVTYSRSGPTVSGERVTVKIRDFEGVDDGLAIDTRPPGATVASLSNEHEYNLRNQGWTTFQLDEWENARLGQGIYEEDKPDGYGMPSNCDVSFLFNNLEDLFRPSTKRVRQANRGNSPAPKGHYILTVWDQDRSAVSHVNGVVGKDTDYQRPSTCAFFAGRIFWAGINYVDFNSKIYFSQIVERDEQYGSCYQQNDGSSEEAFDLLPADGGVISIPEAGTIYKIVSITGAVAVFAANGVWMISGSTGIGFTAKDYTVTKLSSINTISATSFVDIGGYPAWWNAEGIYFLTTDGNNPKIDSLTDQRIKKYYNDIPLASKTKVRGFFNLVTGVVQWLYRSTEANEPEEDYEYDTILNFNLLTTAFYPWSIPTSAVKVHSIVVLDGGVGTLAFQDVVDSSNVTVTDDDGETVEAFFATNVKVGPSFKYLTSYASGASDLFTFAECRDVGYLDWQSYDTGTRFVSYFISGYKLHGQAMRKFQSNYVRFFSRNEVPTKYRVQGIWDFANTPSGTGRWSSRQLIVHDNSRFDNMSKRLKIRGHGLALQFRAVSVEEEPFDLLGWSLFETGNQAP